MSSVRDTNSANGLTQTLQLARAGDTEAEERLLELCRNYVLVQAQRQLQSNLAPRVDASDIVQQTMMDAWRGLREFRGTTTPELLAWLKQIIARNAIDAARYHRLAAKRCADREVSLATPISGESHTAHDPAGLDDTPSECAMKCEEELLLADAIAELSADYQHVLICRSLLHQSFAEVAEQMNRSRPAVQMLWLRAVKQLRRQLTAKGLHHVEPSTSTTA